MAEQKSTPTIIIDATSAVLGRLASFAAKQALLGKKVIIVNCNDILVTGSKANIIANFKQKRARGGSAQKGPYYSRTPERIVKRTIRGMLPYTKGRGSESLDRVICYNTTPKEYESEKKIHAGRELRTKAIQLKHLSDIM